MKFQRVWAMPNADTFSIPEIGAWVKGYLMKSKVSIDPFARNKRWATHTNDLNPQTAADYHLDAITFLALLRDRGVRADLLILDPPYSPRQLKECYDNIGVKMKQEDAWGGRTRKLWRETAMPMLTDDAVVLSFGWNSGGFGVEHFTLEEILLVCHGSDHNDTICLAERRIPKLRELFDSPAGTL